MLRLMRMVDWRTTRRCFTATAMNGAGTLPTGGKSVHGTWKDGCSADPKWRRGGTAASGSDGVARKPPPARSSARLSGAGAPQKGKK